MIRPGYLNYGMYATYSYAFAHEHAHLEALDGLVLRHTSRAVGAAHYGSVATSLLATTSISPLLGHVAAHTRPQHVRQPSVCIFQLTRQEALRNVGTEVLMVV